MNPVEPQRLKGVIEGPLPWPLEIDPCFLSDLTRRMQTSVVNAMAYLKQERICYPDHLEELGDLKRSDLAETSIAAFPNRFFEVIHPCTLSLRTAAMPSETIHALLDPSSTVIAMDCLVATHIALTYALMKECGDAFLNTLFTADSNYRLTFKEGELYRPLYYLQTMETRLKPSELQLGDLVYFCGVDGYRKKHPQGYWGGLNAICVETGHTPRFDAHGLHQPSTASEICRSLEEAMQEPSIPHRARGWGGNALRWNFPKILYLQQFLNER